MLNVVLFVPAGFLLSIATRRPVASLGALVALSAAVELAQSVLGSHSCTGGDWKANSLGAALGVAAGIGLRSVRRPAATPVPRCPDARDRPPRG